MPFNDLGLVLGHAAHAWFSEACDDCQKLLKLTLFNAVHDITEVLIEHNLRIAPSLRALFKRGVSRRNGVWKFGAFSVAVRRLTMHDDYGDEMTIYLLDTVQKHHSAPICESCFYGKTLH